MACDATATVFDIKRFAMHDGPGLRTTVFLKGCNLLCKWCSNPESQKFRPELRFLDSKCTNCGDCDPVCPHGAHITGPNGHRFLAELCQGCGKCVDACYQDALKISGRTMTVEEVMMVVLRDRTYYDNSGGGLTLSGGEALLQPEFCQQLLKAARSEGIHTCIQTAAHVSTSVFAQVAPLTSMFLFDLKLSDPELHRQWTGVDTRRILEALDFLAAYESEVLLRCIIIPGINDNDSHFQNLVRLYREHDHVCGIEIMPYHDLGAVKYAQLGRTCEMNHPKPSIETANSWVRRLTELGCDHVTKT